MGLNEAQKKARSEYLENNLNITECSQRKPYVFISYASDNWETVFKTVIVPMQKQYGLCVYADKAFDTVNDKWIVPMLRNVRGADVVVAFVSQSYIESYACFMELLTAVNNRKQIVFVSLEDRLHLGDTTDLPAVERGVKNEILNQGANLATNTNNTSNDIMRAMKSAYTSISTLLEQDALSKYDISDAFINFFRDASINRKSINDLNAVKGTIESVSSSVFDKKTINYKPEKAAKSKPVPPKPIPQPAPESIRQQTETPQEAQITQTAQTQTAAAEKNAPPPEPVQTQVDQTYYQTYQTTEQNNIKKETFDMRGNKLKAIIAAAAGVCVLAVVGIVIGINASKSGTEIPVSNLTTTTANESVSNSEAPAETTSNSAAEESTGTESGSLLSLAAPTNFSTYLDGDDVACKWDTVNGAEGYEIEIANDDGFTDMVFTTSTDAGSNGMELSGMSLTKTRYYRIRAVKGGEYSDWTTAVYDPESGGSAAEAVLAAPTNFSAYPDGDNVVCKWDTVNGAEGYEIEIANDDGFTDMVFTTNAGAEAKVLELSGMSLTKTRYYRIRAVKGGEYSDWTTAVFDPANGSSAAAAVLAAPTNFSAYPDGDNVVCKWDTVNGAEGYEIEIANDDGFTDMVFTTNAGAEAKVLELSGMSLTKTRYYRIRAVKGDEYSDWTTAVYTGQ